MLSPLVAMSASAMPRLLRPAMIDVIDCAAASRAALTVGFVRVTPRLTRATSGTTVTLPVPETVMVRAGSVPGSLGAPATAAGLTESAATATTRAPSATAPRVRRVCDIGPPAVMLSARSRSGSSRQTTARVQRFRASGLPDGRDAERQRGDRSAARDVELIAPCGPRGAVDADEQLRCEPARTFRRRDVAERPGKGSDVSAV